MNSGYTRTNDAGEFGINVEQEKQQNRKKYLYSVLSFLVGCGLTGLIIYLVWRSGKSSDDDSGAKWDAKDYQEGWQFYEKIEAHPINVQDNMRLSRLGAPVLSPDGKTVVFTRTQFEQQHLNRSATSLWAYRLPVTDGFAAKPVTKPIWGVHDSQPNFGSDSSVVYFLSNRGSGDAAGDSTQLFETSLPSSLKSVESVSEEQFNAELSANTPLTHTVPSLPNVGSASYEKVKRITDFPVDIDNLLIGRTAEEGRAIFAISARVYPNMSMQETADRKAEIASTGGNFHVHDKLYIRHWDEWHDGTRNHIFLMSAQRKGGELKLSEPLDILKGIDADAPTRPFGGVEEWSFSKTSQNFAFVYQTFDGEAKVAWNTNLDVYTIKLQQGKDNQLDVVLPAICQTCDNLATDNQPRYSPVEEDDFIYLATATPGYESDRYTIKYVRAGRPAEDLTDDWTLSVSAASWTASGSKLLVTYAHRGRYKVLSMPLEQTKEGMVLLEDGTNGNVVPGPDDATLLYTYTSYQQPTTIRHYDAGKPEGKRTKDLTSGFNMLALSKMEVSATIDFTFKGANDEEVHGFLLRPAGFDPRTKYPLAFLIHGGPQSAWNDAWSYRWNPQMYTAAGYMTVLVNFHGSDSYSQAFTDSITGNYGTLPYEDLLKALDYLLEESEHKANIDSERMAALGASYGGYMINWIAGHNADHKYPFKVLVNHDGIFDFRSFYYSTEEIFFPEHDMQGTVFDKPDNYEKFNPAAPERISKWNTPMLVIHGGRDYRIDPSQGIGAFTALQRQGIPSKFLYFPNEAHQVFNSINQVEWHKQVLDWIGTYTKAE